MEDKRPVVIVEDDSDDCEAITQAIRSLGFENEIRCFNNGRQLLEYLEGSDETPTMILCDIVMPEVDGWEAKRRINADPWLRLKAFPFIFLSSTASSTEVKQAFAMDVNGYFEKASDAQKLRETLKSIFEYWAMSTRPVVY
jgi:CheY-like chemotaxis protein